MITNAMSGNSVTLLIYNQIPTNILHTSLLHTCTVDSTKPVIYMLLEFTN